MFTPHHMIWKFAHWNDELSDWLLDADALIRKWASQTDKEVRFSSTFEIRMASFLLMDGLLPISARNAYACLMIGSINEAEQNKLGLKCLHISAPKPGRKSNRSAIFMRCHEVKKLLEEGKTATVAYRIVSEKHFKSPDTIRRDFERMVKRRKKLEVRRGEIAQ